MSAFTYHGPSPICSYGNQCSYLLVVFLGHLGLALSVNAWVAANHGRTKPNNKHVHCGLSKVIYKWGGGDLACVCISLRTLEGRGEIFCSNHVKLKTSVSDAFLQAIYAALIDSLQPVIILAAFVFMLCVHFILTLLNAYFCAVKATLVMEGRATHPLCMPQQAPDTHPQGASSSRSKFYFVDACLLPSCSSLVLSLAIASTFSFNSHPPLLILFLFSSRLHIYSVMVDSHMIGYHVNVKACEHQFSPIPWQQVMPLVTYLMPKYPNLLSFQQATVYQSIIQVNNHPDLVWFLYDLHIQILFMFWS